MCLSCGVNFSKPILSPKLVLHLRRLRDLVGTRYVVPVLSRPSLIQRDPHFLIGVKVGPNSSRMGTSSLEVIVHKHSI